MPLADTHRVTGSRHARARRTAWATSVAVLAACALVVPALPGGQTAEAGGIQPVISQALPAAYDPVADYEGQATCSPSAKPGTAALAQLIKTTYGAGQTVWIPRNCRIGGISEHKEGRALDWMVSIRKAKQRANAKAFLQWLLGPDQYGVPHGFATRLGVMYIGWNNRIWRSYNGGTWGELRGCFSRPRRGDDTDCHRNHIHISLSWDGASGQTSFWDGSVVAPYCALGPESSAGPAGTPVPEVVPVAAVRVLSTRDGIGLAAPNVGPDGAPVPCRLHNGGWRGDVGLPVKVTGQAGVPEAGVAAVAIAVTAQGSSAPATVSVWQPGATEHTEVVDVGMNRDAAASIVVPVAADGTIAVGTSAGSTDVVIDVVGYYPAAAPPPVIAPSEPAQPPVVTPPVVTPPPAPS